MPTNHEDDITEDCLTDLCDFLQSKGFPFDDFLADLAQRSCSEGLCAELFESLMRVAGLTNRPAFLFLMAWLALNSEKLRECIAIANRMEDDCAPGLTIKGQAQLELGEVDNAISTLTESVVSDCNEILAWFQLAKAHFCQDNFFESWKALDQCDRIQPDNAETALFYALVAIEWKNTDKIQNALDALWKHLDTFRGSDEVVLRLIDLSILANDEKKCLTVISSANWQRIVKFECFHRSIGKILRALHVQGWQKCTKTILDLVTDVSQECTK